MPRRPLLLAVLLLVSGATPVAAQRILPRFVPAGDSSWWAPVASAVIPGLGQAALGQDRFIAYLAVEALAVVAHSNELTQAKREQRRYEELARDVARAFFADVRPKGTFAYYESMEKFLESGVFDRLPGGEVDPDINVTTYNGFLWYVARRTYWRDPDLAPGAETPEFRLAMNMYLSRAIRPEYRWSWRNAQLEQDLFRRTIRRSNQSYRRAREQLGILIANHLLSTVDAFATVRFRTTPEPGAPTTRQLGVTVPWAPFGRPSR